MFTHINSPKAYLVPKEVGEGQFSDERAVRLIDSKGAEHSGFCPENYLGQGRVETRVVSTRGNLALIELPFRLLGGIGRDCYLTVPKNNLAYAI